MDDIEVWISLLQTVGVPSVVCAASFFYIFKKDLWAQAERREYMLREEEADSRVFTLVQNSNDALGEMSKALDIMTKSNEHLADSIGRLIERK